MLKMTIRRLKEFNSSRVGVFVCGPSLWKALAGVKKDILSSSKVGDESGVDFHNESFLAPRTSLDR